MLVSTPKTRVQLSHGLLRATFGVLSIAAILAANLFGGFVFGPQKALAANATNTTINFQARLETASGSIVPDGTYNVQFKLYDGDTAGGTAGKGAGFAGTNLWTETWQNSSSQGVRVANGYLSVSLGSITSFPNTINWDQGLWLTMNIGGTTTSASPTYDGEMNPRLKLTAVPYALRAGQLAAYNSSSDLTSTLSILQPTVGNQSFQIADQGAAGTYTLCVQSAAANTGGCAPTTGGSGYIQNQNTSAQQANLWIQSPSSANQTAIFQAATTAQSADILQIRNSSGVPIAGFGVNSADNGTLYVTSKITVGSSTVSNVANLKVSSTDPTNIAILAVGAQNQTANLVQLQNAGGNVYSGFNSQGGLFTNGTTNTLTGLTYPSGVTVTQVGTIGSTLYAYRVSALNGQGETIAAPEVTTTTGNATLSGTNYNVIQWSSVPGATSYKVYGRTAGAELYMATVTGTGASTYSYNDTGTVTPSGALPTGTSLGAALTVQAGNGGNYTFVVKNSAGQSVFAAASGFNGAAVNGALTINNANSNTTPGLQITNTAAGTVGAYLQAASGQTADLFQFKASDGTTILSKFDANGALGLGTGTAVNPQGSVMTIANGKWISGIDAAGTGYVNMFQVNANNQIQVGAALNIDGGIVLPTNGGQMTLSDLPIDSSASAGTKESYTMRVGSTNALTVYGEADGAGNSQNVRVGIGSLINPQYTLDVAGDINTSGVYRIGGTQVCASTGCTAASGSGYYIQNQNASAQVTSNFWISGTGKAATLQAATDVNVGGTGNAGYISFARPSDGVLGAKIGNSASGNDLELSNSNGTGAITFINNVSGTVAERMRIHTNGYVGIGTSSPAYLLDVNGDINASGLFRSGGTTIAGANASQGLAATGSDYAIRGFNVTNSNFYLQSYNAASTTLFAGLSGTYAGRIGIGTTTPGYKLDVNGDINIASGSVLRIGGTQICSSTGCTGGGGGSYVTLQAGSPGTPDTGNINISGTVIAAAFNGATFDTASAAVLNIGTTNATQINLNKNVVVASGQYISLVGGITSTRPASPTEGMLYYDTTTKKLLVYANGKWQADRSSSTVIVGTSVTDATSGAVASKAPDGADYVNSSITSAQTVINSAISSLGSAGGTVYLMEGTYIVDGGITIPNNVTLAGAGQGATIIKLKNATGSTTVPMMVNSDSTNGNSNITLKDFTMDGNKANNASGNYAPMEFTKVGSGTGATAVNGLSITNVTVMNSNYSGVRLISVANSRIANLTVLNSVGDGITNAAGNTLTNVVFTGLHIQGNAGTGISLTPSADGVTVSNSVVEGNNNGISANAAPGLNTVNDTFTGNVIRNNSGPGLTLTSTGGTNARNTVTGNTFTGNGSFGINLNTTSDDIVSNNVITDSSSHGIQLLSSNNVTVSGNRIANSGTGTTNADGINVNGSNSNTITDNTITDTAGGASAYAIEIVSGSSNYIGNNQYSGTGASSINDAGTGTIFANQLNASGQLNSSNSAGVSIQAASGQSADLLDIKASDGTTVLAKFDSTGALTVPKLTVNGVVSLQETAAPTATAGFGKLYVSSGDHALHFMNASGTDIALGAGGGGGSSSHVKTVTMVPEYTGAVFNPSGTNNSGYMSSGYAHGAIPGNHHNYYDWTTDQTTAQNYDIVLQYQLPSDYSSFVGGSWKLWTYVDSLTSTGITWDIRSANDTDCYASTQSAKPGSATTWTQISLADPGNGCTFAAGDTITIDINTTAIQPTTNQVRVGEFTYSYNSAY